jgi:two-component system OmpR family sensor kinase
MRLRIRNSLRARLLLLLFGAVVLTACVQAFIAYRTSLDETNEIFDYQMEQMALSLRPGLPVGGYPNNGFRDDKDESFEFIVQVSTAAGERIFQSTAKTELPRQDRTGFSSFEAHGTTYKLYSLVYGTQLIQVAQDRAARRGLARTLAYRTASPILVMVPLLIFLVWWVVTSALQPVNRVRRQIATREADALNPVETSGLPAEVRPLVEELNLLFTRMRQAFAAQKNFVADAAHELRSPLAALRLQVEQLRRSTTDKEREVAVLRLGTGVDRATRLVEQLLILARQQTGHAEAASMAAVDLKQMLQLVLHDATYQAQSRQLQLEARLDAATVPGQTEALRILASNLLSNAIKYTPPLGRILLTLRAQADGVLLCIEDSGPGIAEEDRLRVLDRFYRVPGAEGSGSGLGLAIVKTIVEVHAGTLAMDRSDSLGGLRVSVRLRAAQRA